MPVLACLLALALTDVRTVPIAHGWARTSVNAVVFRRNSVVSDDTHQFVAFYDAGASVVLAKRELGSSEWEIRKTRYKGKASDAHNAISIHLDGDGFLHMAWDHHGDELRYCRSKQPGSLDLTDRMPMTGKREAHVTYPEFYALPEGNLLFLYRDGGSGNGDLLGNTYSTKEKAWSPLPKTLLSGEGQRNAYWQACVDGAGTIHLSWVWRETGDIATNHDLCYAKSADGGKTWTTSEDRKYVLPVTQSSAEYAARVPAGRQLINTTSMCADEEGRPYIASYWAPPGSDVPQYHLVRHDGRGWKAQQVTHRSQAFTLGGHGTRRIPISRCQVFTRAVGDKTVAYLLFRDAERGDRVTLASCRKLDQADWRFEDLTDHPVGFWEPSYDTEHWSRAGELHVFLQRVGQKNGEGLENLAPQMVSILEWTPGDR